MVSLAKNAFVRAVSNDSRGVVSRNDAEKIVDAAISDIAKAEKPTEAFAEASRYVSASRTLVGTDAQSTQILSSFQNRAQSAVAARLTALTGQTQLPVAVERVFAELVEWDELGASGAIKLTNVNGDRTKGFAFDYDVGGTTGKAHAFQYEGEWIVSPVKISKSDFDTATAAMRDYFDNHWATDLVDGYGHTPAEVADMRASITPSGFVWPANSDPIGISDTYPVALRFHNPTGSDHGFYAGVDPATGDTDAGDFN